MFRTIQPLTDADMNPAPPQDVPLVHIEGIKPEALESSAVIKPSPFFFLMCDDRHCASSARQDTSQILTRDEADKFKLEHKDDPNSNEKYISHITALFLNYAHSQGWAIGMDSQFCPYHTKMMRQREAEIKAMQAEIERHNELHGQRVRVYSPQIHLDHAMRDTFRKAAKVTKQ